VSVLESAPAPPQWRYLLGPLALDVISKLEEFVSAFIYPSQYLMAEKYE